MFDDMLLRREVSGTNAPILSVRIQSCTGTSRNWEAQYVAVTLYVSFTEACMSLLPVPLDLLNQDLHKTSQIELIIYSRFLKILCCGLG